MEPSSLRVLEFYSGIGGMHYALMSSEIKASVVAAFDINTCANNVYRSNFPRTHLCQRNICGLTVEYIEQLQGDVFLMSPPCQPFTRQGNKADDKDNRTNSFLRILDILLQLTHKPGHVLIENVQGFEVSATRHHLITTLIKCGYTYQEFLLTPTQFGIPNSRLRYYLLAKRTPLKFHFSTTDKPMITLPDDITRPCVTPLCNFIQPMSISEEDKLLVPPEVLLRYVSVLDIVQEDSIQCCCFTKAYGYYVEGTGSVLQCNSDGDLDEAFREYIFGGKKTADSLVKLRLRYFSPTEVAGLLWFPARFQFPCDVTTKQQYKLLGNSLNVHVVSVLLRRILFNGYKKLRT